MEEKPVKRYLIIAVLVVALAALLASTALAGPVDLSAQGFGFGTRTQAQDPAADTCGCGGAGATGRNMMGRGAMAWAGQSEELTALLGVTAEEIQAGRQAGKSLAEIMASKGVEKDELVDTLMAARKANLDQLVADGKLTQDQAKLMIEHMQTQIESMVERTTTGPMMGRGQGMRGGVRGLSL
jgi:hypothetical protein